MAEEPTNTTPQPPAAGRRRSSFAGQTFADLFANSNRQQQPRPSEAPPQSPPTQGPIAAAAQQANQRRLSVTTLGLSGSPNQTSPFGSFRGGRRESISSANSGSVDESAIAEDDVSGQKDSNPTTPFGRRMSFGAKALRDVRGGTNNAGSNGRSPPVTGSGNATAVAPPYFSHKGRTPSYNGTISSRDVKGRGLSRFPPSHPISSSFSTIPPQHPSDPHFHSLNSTPTQKLTTLPNTGSIPATTPGGTATSNNTNSEGFNWSENFRTRAERSSISGGSIAMNPQQSQAYSNHTRAKSVANSSMEPPKEMPREPPQQSDKAKPMLQQRPDHFQERILKGDFYMD